MKIIFSVLLVVALLFTMFALCVSADPTPEGTGISTQEELSAMDPNGTYYLEKDIVIHGDWKYTQKFAGVLNGNGKTIYFDHATVTGGLFTFISGGNIVKHVRIFDLNIVELDRVRFVPFYEGSNTSAIGVLAAQVGAGMVEITNVSAYANITVDEGTYQNTIDYNDLYSGIIMGGIVGEARFTTLLTFERCIFMGSLTNEISQFKGSANARSSMGGILGSSWGNKNYKDTIPASRGKVLTLSFKECINYGNLTANSRLGGMIGYTYSETRWTVGTFTIERCINYGNITSEYLNTETDPASGVGGFFGRRMNFGDEVTKIIGNINYGTITGSKSTNRGGIGGHLQVSGAEHDSTNPSEVGLEQLVIKGNVNFGKIETTEKGEGVAEIDPASIIGCYRTTTGAKIVGNNTRNEQNYHIDDLDNITLSDTMDQGERKAFSGVTDDADIVLDALNEMYPDVYIGLNLEDGDDENDLIVLKWAADAGLSATAPTVTPHLLIHHDAKAPTCTEIGWYAYDTCSYCGYTTYEEIPALGHNYVSTVTKPTCTDGGFTTHTCSRCGYSYRAEATNALGHDLIHHNAQSATCTEIGWDAYDTCSRCDYTTYEEIPALGHDYVSTVTKPTCTDGGFTTHTCSRCGHSYVDSIVTATGHTASDWITTKEVTLTEEGSKHKVCTICGEELEIAEIAISKGMTDFAQKVNEIDFTASRTTCFNAIKNAIVAYSTLNEEERAIVSDQYATLHTYTVSYNESAKAVNDNIGIATKNAFSLFHELSTILSGLWIALKDLF